MGRISALIIQSGIFGFFRLSAYWGDCIASFPASCLSFLDCWISMKKEIPFMMVLLWEASVLCRLSVPFILSQKMIIRFWNDI